MSIAELVHGLHEVDQRAAEPVQPRHHNRVALARIREGLNAAGSPHLTLPHLSTAACPTILVVEDNHDVAQMLAQLLVEAGYPTRVAFDGPSALQAAAEAPAEVALVDIGLPVRDGYEVCRRFTKLPKPPRLLVAVTGYGQPDDARRAREAGFHVHLVKPVDIHQIILAIGALPQT